MKHIAKLLVALAREGYGQGVLVLVGVMTGGVVRMLGMLLVLTLR